MKHPEKPELLDLLDGIHFHTLCEQDSDDLETTLTSVKKHLEIWLPGVKWINFFWRRSLRDQAMILNDWNDASVWQKEEWNVEVYLEPGEAWALNGIPSDPCAGCSEKWRDRNCDRRCQPVICRTYWKCLIDRRFLEQMIQKRTGSQFGLEAQPVCREMIGDYKFRQLPEIWGFSLCLRYAIYTTCKNNTFNGMPLPDIWLRRADNTMQQRMILLCRF